MSGSEKPRHAIRWYVRESQYSIFHLQPPLHKDQALMEVLSSADLRTELLLDRLGVANVTNAIAYKMNWWLYSMTGSTRGSWGQVTTSGIDIYNSGIPWLEHVEPLIHEEIHAIWGRCFGEAPALLNEGVPEYFQRLVQDDPAQRLCELELAWRNMASEQGFLGRLCANEEFWKAKMERKPVYGIAGMVVRYLVEHLGVAVLQQMFLHTHYESNSLAMHLKTRTGRNVDELELDIGEHIAGKE